MQCVIRQVAWAEQKMKQGANGQPLVVKIGGACLACRDHWRLHHQCEPGSGQWEQFCRRCDNDPEYRRKVEGSRAVAAGTKAKDFHEEFMQSGEEVALEVRRRFIVLSEAELAQKLGVPKLTKIVKDRLVPFLVQKIGDGSGVGENEPLYAFRDPDKPYRTADLVTISRVQSGVQYLRPADSCWQGEGKYHLGIEANATMAAAGAHAVMQKFGNRAIRSVDEFADSVKGPGNKKDKRNKRDTGDSADDSDDDGSDSEGDSDGDYGGEAPSAITRQAPQASPSKVLPPVPPFRQASPACGSSAARGPGAQSSASSSALLLAPSAPSGRMSSARSATSRGSSADSGGSGDDGFDDEDDDPTASEGLQGPQSPPALSVAPHLVSRSHGDVPFLSWPLAPPSNFAPISENTIGCTPHAPASEGKHHSMAITAS